MFQDDEKPQELLVKPRDYIVKFTFPNPAPLNPPILGLHSEMQLFAYFCLALGWVYCMLLQHMLKCAHFGSKVCYGIYVSLKIFF